MVIGVGPVHHHALQRQLARLLLAVPATAPSAGSVPGATGSDQSEPPAVPPIARASVAFRSAAAEAVAVAVTAPLELRAPTTMYEDSWYSFVPEIAPKKPATNGQPQGHRRKESLLQQPNVRRLHPQPPSPRCGVGAHRDRRA